MALFKAQLDNYGLDIEDIADELEKSLVVHEYPLVDGADITDMGMQARSVRFRCYFWGEGYDTHKDFIAHVQKNKILQLVHPVYGVLYGRVRRTSVHHDDRQKTAEIDVDFIEERQGEQKVSFDERIVPEIESLFVSAQPQEMSAFAEWLQGVVGTVEASDIIANTISVGENLIDNYQTFVGASRLVIRDIDTDLTMLDTLLARIAQPADSIINTVDYGENLPGRIMSSIGACVERYSVAIESVASGPAAYISSFTGAINAIAAQTTTLSRHVKSVGALYGSVVVARMYYEDEKQWKKFRKLERSTGFDINGRRINTETINEVLTVTELERSLAMIREFINDVFILDRSVTALADCARVLSYHVYELVIERNQIITIVSTSPTPLHSICMRYGLHYNYAERIVRLNPHIPNPSYCEGEIKIYAPR